MSTGFTPREEADAGVADTQSSLEDEAGDDGTTWRADAAAAAGVPPLVDALLSLPDHIAPEPPPPAADGEVNFSLSSSSLDV